MTVLLQVDRAAPFDLHNSASPNEFQFHPSYEQRKMNLLWTIGVAAVVLAVVLIVMAVVLLMVYPKRRRMVTVI